MDAKDHKPYLTAAFIVLLCSLPAAAQSPPTPISPRTVAAHASGEATELSARRLRTVWFERSQRVFPLVERALRMEDSLIKVRTIIDLADLLWDYDETYARQLFQTAYNELKANNGASPASETNNKRLMAALIAKLVKRDYKEGREIVNGASGADPVVRLLAARALVQTDSSRAAELAEQSLSESTLSNINSLLFDLRLGDQAASDALFLRVMKFAVAQPSLDPDDLAKLGTYVFNSPALSPSLNGYEVTAVGGQHVINLSADRPGVSPEITRAYLGAAVTILTRPVADPRQQQLYYITGRQLLPRVMKFLPSRGQELAETLRTLSGMVSPILTQDSTYDSLSGESYQLKLDVSLSTIDKANDDTARDELCVGMAHAFAEENKLNEALTVAGRIKDTGVRAAVINLLNFRRAAKLLGRDEILKARVETEALDQSVARSILWLGIAGKQAESGDKDAAVESVDKAVNDARKLSDPRSPQLLIAAAGVLAKAGSLLAWQTLSEGVQDLNRRETSSQSPATWSEQVKVGRVSRDFSLAAGGTPLSLKEALPPLLAYDYDETLSNVLTIKNEHVLGQALVVIAKATLGAAAAHGPLSKR